MLFKFQKIVGCIEPWVKNRDTNRIVSLCIVTALIDSLPLLPISPRHYSTNQHTKLHSICSHLRMGGVLFEIP